MTESPPAAVRTDTGHVRDHNEDRALVIPDADTGCGLVLCVADGMGGHPAGDDAAQLAVDAVAQWRTRAPEVAAKADEPFPALLALLDGLIAEGHRAILEAGRRDPAKRGLGTTVVTALLHQRRLGVLHCGDSRAYRLRGDVLEQLTRDHVVVDDGMRYLAAHLGMPEALRLERREIAVAPGDRVLLCSDGLTDMADPLAFGDRLRKASDPEEAAAALVELALENGGHDNVTCAVAFVAGEPTADAEEADAVG